MKQSKTMRLVSALLVLTLMTTCAVSGTFAKYVTSTNGEDAARVAYWGFDQPSAIEFDLFSAEYDGTVKSKDGKNVVAPGTSQSTTIAFHYTDNEKKNLTAPEVDYRFTIDVDTYGSTIELDANPSFKWTLERYEGFVEEYDTLAQLEKAVRGLAGTVTGTQVYEAGTLPQQFDLNDDNSVKIGWKWDYEKTAEVEDEIWNDETDEVEPVYGELTDEMITAQDSRDTIMGNAQSLDNVNIKITIKAEQVD